MKLLSLRRRIEKLNEDGDGFAPLSPPPSQPPKCFLHKPLSHPFLLLQLCLLFLCVYNHGDYEHDDNGNGPITVPLLLPFKDWSTKLQAWSMMAKV
jgi:hypothetical protein